MSSLHVAIPLPSPNTPEEAFRRWICDYCKCASQCHDEFMAIYSSYDSCSLSVLSWYHHLHGANGQQESLYDVPSCLYQEHSALATDTASDQLHAPSSDSQCLNVLAAGHSLSTGRNCHMADRTSYQPCRSLLQAVYLHDLPFLSLGKTEWPDYDYVCNLRMKCSLADYRMSPPFTTKVSNLCTHVLHTLINGSRLLNGHRFYRMMDVWLPAEPFVQKITRSRCTIHFLHELCIAVVLLYRRQLKWLRQKAGLSPSRKVIWSLYRFKVCPSI